MSIKLVGILNVTPDSFSDGGRYVDPAAAIKHAEELFADGASIVDIGAEATNPQANPISADEEWHRLESIVPRLLPNRPDFSYSIDTYRPETVERAIQFGRKFILNDVTTFRNPRMVAVAAKFDLKVIVSHMPLAAEGNIAEVHRSFMMDAGLGARLRQELQNRKAALLAAGLKNDRIIFDPGIGFGKDMRFNWKLLTFAELVGRDPDFSNDIMLGFSHKRLLAYDPITGIEKRKSDRYGKDANQAAAKIAINAYRSLPPDKRQHDLLLRVHEPEWYKELLAS